MPWAILFGALCIYLLIIVGTIVIKDMQINTQTMLATREAAIDANAIDPANGQAIAQELVNDVSGVVPVGTTTITYNPTPPTTSSVAMNGLLVNVNTSDGSYVTITMIYGMQMPASGLLSRVGYTQSTPIPLNAQFSFRREW